MLIPSRASVARAEHDTTKKELIDFVIRADTSLVNCAHF